MRHVWPLGFVLGLLLGLLSVASAWQEVFR